MNTLYFPRRIYDKVHDDMVRLTLEETDVINSPDFQRLRWICQTGLLKMIWPSATHTRFEHSVGVVHTAQQMLDALEQSSRDDTHKLYDMQMDAVRTGMAICYHTLPSDLLAQIQRVTRLCALVHDLGHGPFSHAFEVFAPRTADVAGFLDDERLTELQPYREALLRSKHGRVSHEATSCILFAALWSEMRGEAWIPAIVTSVLLNVEPAPTVSSRLCCWVPFIRDIVSSAPLDADRLDYLARDSAATGVAYGHIDRYRILKSILCVLTKREAEPTQMRLGWRKSGLRAIEHAVVARFNMFAQVYHHKTLRATELMFRDMAAAAVESSENALFPAATLDEFRGGFARMGDELFIRTLAGHVRTDYPKSERIRSLANKILNRDLYKRVFDFDRGITPEAAQRVADRLSAAFPESRFILDALPLKATKDLERGALLLSQDECKRYRVNGEPISWIEASPTIRTLREDEPATIRLFVEPRRAKSEEKALRIREEILAAIAAESV